MDNNTIDSNKYKFIENKICPYCYNKLETNYDTFNYQSINNYKSSSNFIAAKPIVSIGYYYCRNCDKTF